MRTTLVAFLGLAFALPAIAEDDTKLKVKEGDKMPAFVLKAADPETGKVTQIDMNELKGKKNVVLFFYPKAMTGGCTIESCGFRDVAKEFAKENTTILGISTDNVASQKKFIDKEKLNFPLLADDSMMVTKMLGVARPGGKVSQRVTFVVDKEGTIRKIYDTVKVKDHPKEVLEYIREELK